jgi:hypothetical protein
LRFLSELQTSLISLKDLVNGRGLGEDTAGTVSWILLNLFDF